MLDYFEDVMKGKEFILQEKIEGVEISVEGFYVDGKLVQGTLNSTLEAKKFLEGDKGENTGCAGSAVRIWKEKQPKIYRLTLKKLEPFLERFGYAGALDVNCIVSEKDKMPYFIELTTRFGYNSVYALAEGLNEPIGEFISKMALRRPVAAVQRSYDWLGAVRVSIPPYPSELGTAKSAGRPIRGVDSLEHIWLLDAMLKNDKILTAGVDGVICEVTGKGKNMNALAQVIYARIDKLKIPDKQFRSDIFDVAEERITKLRQWKYL